MPPASAPRWLTAPDATRSGRAENRAPPAAGTPPIKIPVIDVIDGDLERVQRDGG